ncbi:MAG: dethiobiotin synthase [Nitrospirae bacterium]|nr:dethiobiotin synthase [Nitrospirota bacterium]
MFKGFFITATDTGVGKTIIAGALIKVIQSFGIKTCAMKPVESGCGKEGDILIPYDGTFLRQAAHMEEPMRLITPYCFENPLSPYAAAEIEGRTINIDEIKKAYYTLYRSYESIIVEGIGGLMVPLKKDYYVVDLAKEFALPLLIVAKPGLGTINHTMLTVNYALEAGLEVAGLIINYSRPSENSLAEKNNPKVLEEICPVPVIGTFPYLKGMGEDILEMTALRNFDLEILKKYIL